MKNGVKVVAVIPAYNEEKRVGPVIADLRDYVDEVLVSDDGSSDGTARIAKGLGAKVISSERNRGVGHATRTGCEHAVEKLGARVIVLLDADGQHPPSKIPELLSALGDGCDFVFANRFAEPEKMPFLKRVGNRGLSFATNLVAGTNVHDSQCGFKAFKADAYQKLRLVSDGYEICSEFVLEVGRKRIRNCEVPISAEYDDWTSVKGTGVRTGIKIFARLVRLALSK